MRGEKNHIDEWLQKQIKNGITIIDKVLNNNINEWELYYTGHLQKDILTNFPGRTSKKIFAKLFCKFSKNYYALSN